MTDGDPYVCWVHADPSTYPEQIIVSHSIAGAASEYRLRHHVPPRVPINVRPADPPLDPPDASRPS